jgi:hypothetical protein
VSTDTATDTDGNNIFAATLQRTELSDFQKLIGQTVRPILTVIEVPIEAKLRPVIVAVAEPDDATSEYAADKVNGEFQENSKLIDLVNWETETNVFDIDPYPDATFPSTALFELQSDDTVEVNPTRIEFDNPTEENPDPKIVKLAPPLDGLFVVLVEDTDTGTTNEALKTPNPTPTDALTTKFRTDPNPEATLKVKELSENQFDLSEVDPCSFGWGEAVMPKNIPKTEMLTPPDEGIALAVLMLETRGEL